MGGNASGAHSPAYGAHQFCTKLGNYARRLARGRKAPRAASGDGQPVTALMAQVYAVPSSNFQGDRW